MSIRKKLAQWIYPSPPPIDIKKILQPGESYIYSKGYERGYNAAIGRDSKSFFMDGYEEGYNAHKKEIADQYKGEYDPNGYIKAKQ